MQFGSPKRRLNNARTTALEESQQGKKERDRLICPSSARSFIVATGAGQDQQPGTALSVTHYTRENIKVQVWPTLGSKGEVTKDLEK